IVAREPGKPSSKRVPGASEPLTIGVHQEASPSGVAIAEKTRAGGAASVSSTVYSCPGAVRFGASLVRPTLRSSGNGDTRPSGQPEAPRCGLPHLAQAVAGRNAVGRAARGRAGVARATWSRGQVTIS